MLIDGLITELQNNAGVAALVDADVFKNVLPRGYTLPAIVLHRYGGSQDYDFNGPTSDREDQIQVDCYGPDPDVAALVGEAVRSCLVPYRGTLPDGTVVTGCYLERDMDMPYLAHADAKGIADRTLLGFRVVSVRV